MKKSLTLLLATLTVAASADGCAGASGAVPAALGGHVFSHGPRLADRQKSPQNFVFVKGGTFKNTKSNYYGKLVTISSFYMDKYLITQKEWIKVMGTNPSKFHGDRLPVESVSWYDCIEYCNKRSIKEGLQPYYNVDKNKTDPGNESDLDTIKWTVAINHGANGYRLPTEAEWEYAAGGGLKSKSYTYSGSNDLDTVGWYWKNSGDKYLTGLWHWPTLVSNKNQSKPVGVKKPNELGLYDMSGNVREWCWDWYVDVKGAAKGGSNGSTRVWKGGGWVGAGFCCKPSFRGSLAANGTAPDEGVRVCRGK